MPKFWYNMALLQSVHRPCTPHPVLKNGTFLSSARISAIHILRDSFRLHPRRQTLNGFSQLRISKYVPGSKLERGVSACALEQNSTASKPKRGRPRKKKPEDEHTDKATQANSNGSVPAKKRGRKKKENLRLEEFLSKSLDTLLSEKDGEDSPSNFTVAENAQSSAAEQTLGGMDYGIKIDDQPDFVDEEDYDWPDEADAIVEDRWKVRASDYFTEPLIRNVRDDHGNVIDWEGEADNYSIKEICSLEWEALVFHPSPLIVLVFQRYRRVSDNWKALKELEKAIQVYWDSKNKLPPRTVKIDAKVEKDLASALEVEETPELLFIRGSKLLHRETEIRTADELVKMIAHFYYNAKRPAWLKMTALDTEIFHTKMDDAERQRYGSPCAACKTLRKKCQGKCLLAPYFPPTNRVEFANAHKVFGASAIIKTIEDLPVERRAVAVSNMVYEATARVNDPLHGCAGMVLELQKQVWDLQAQLANAQAELLKMQSHRSNLKQLISEFRTPVTAGSLHAVDRENSNENTYVFGDVDYAQGWEPVWTIVGEGGSDVRVIGFQR